MASGDAVVEWVGPHCAIVNSQAKVVVSSSGDPLSAEYLQECDIQNWSIWCHSLCIICTVHEHVEEETFNYFVD